MKEPFGHGGADSYLWQLFAEALRTGAKEAPIPLREGLRMTLPGIYAAESAIRGGERLTIHYPWERDFAGYPCFPAGMTFPCGVHIPAEGSAGLFEIADKCAGDGASERTPVIGGGI